MSLVMEPQSATAAEPAGARPPSPPPTRRLLLRWVVANAVIGLVAVHVIGWVPVIAFRLYFSVMAWVIAVVLLGMLAVVVGSAQSLALGDAYRRRLSGSWGTATGAGLAVGVGLSVLAFPLLYVVAAPGTRLFDLAREAGLYWLFHLVVAAAPAGLILMVGGCLGLGAGLMQARRFRAPGQGATQLRAGRLWRTWWPAASGGGSAIAWAVAAAIVVWGDVLYVSIIPRDFAIGPWSVLAGVAGGLAYGLITGPVLVWLLRQRSAALIEGGAP